MERPSKKCVPVFDSFYPSKEELDWLVNNNYFEQLEKRLNDKTSENAIRDIVTRRKNEMEIADLNQIVDKSKFPLDILKEIALFMDIRDVLNQSMKNSSFLLIVMDDQFWKKRFELDFPEILWFKNSDLSEQKGTDKFKNQPWRRYYNVVRYYMVRYVYHMLVAFIRSIQPKRNFSTDIVFEHKQVRFRVIIRMSSNYQIGDTKYLDMNEFCKFVGIDRKSYLFEYEKKIINHTKMMRYDVFRLEVLQRQSSQLYEEIQQGYVEKTGDKIIIGNCIMCATETNMVEASNKNLAFCSESCHRVFYEQ